MTLRYKCGLTESGAYHLTIFHDFGGIGKFFEDGEPTYRDLVRMRRRLRGNTK